MKRRDFSIVGMSGLALSQSWIAPAFAQVTVPAAGADYLVLDKKVAVEAPSSKIEAVEFFWYNCPHCNAFEPILGAWIKRAPKDIAVRRVPVGFRDEFVPQQRLFYCLEAMNLADKLHGKVFAAIHAENVDLTKSAAIADWIAKQGVDRAKFLETYNSFAVATKASKATQLQNAYRVEGVPAMGVAGRFYTDGSLAGNMPRVLQVVDYLATQVRAGR